MRHRILSGLLVVAVMALMTARPAQAADDDTQAVKAAVATFHDALNVLFTGDVMKQGAGRLTLARANSYSGITTISAGTIALSGAGRVGTGGLNLGTAGSP